MILSINGRPTDREEEIKQRITKKMLSELPKLFKGARIKERRRNTVEVGIKMSDNLIHIFTIKVSVSQGYDLPGVDD